MPKLSMKQILMLLLVVVAGGSAALAQSKTTGTIKGRVSNSDGKSVAAANITVMQDARDVARATTKRNGEFEIGNLAPGTYNIVARKDGLKTATITDVKVISGKTNRLRENQLILPADEATLAVLRGSVFDERGLSVRGAQVEIARLNPDGSSSKRFDARLSTETGQFAFRLSPEAAKYRVTVKADGAETISQDVTVEGASIHRIAFTLKKAN